MNKCLAIIREKGVLEFLKRVKVYVCIRLSSLLARMLYPIFSLLPLQNKVVATAFQGKKYGDNPAYIFEAINQKNTGIKLLWMVDGKFEVPQWVKAIPYSGLLLTRYHLATAKVIIDTHHFHAWTKKRKGQLYIETWHGGLGIKKLELEVPEFQNLKWLKDLTAHTCRMADVFISQSDHLSRIYRSAFHYDGLIFKCGYPKNDILINGDAACRELVRSYYNIDKETRIFLYAPTYRSSFFDKIDMSQFIIDTDALRKALESKFGGKWVIMFRWHPKFAEQLSQEYKENSSGTIDSTDFQDMQKLLLGVDVVLSDYSSCIFDAALLDIPCFTYATDFDIYKAERGVYYEMEELPFPYARNNEELIENIKNYDHEAYLERWCAFKERMGLYEPGNASVVISDIIINFIHNNILDLT
ncbi:MAG: CDP-glycerol glycerophosphotransferase family protein [Muribaculaceae bacterium]|nr:CDP-glycerol glycerophosphotransferase family protein [Muribaculaceae bacterium]